MILPSRKKRTEDLKFNVAECNAIDKSKYIESQKVNRDLYFDEQGRPSQTFYVWWINNFAENFRKAWPTSLCYKCKKVAECKDCLQEKCSKFEIDPNWEKKDLIKKLYDIATYFFKKLGEKENAAKRTFHRSGR